MPLLTLSKDSSLRKATVAIFAAGILTSGCALQVKAPPVAESNTQDVSRQLDKFVAVLGLIEQGRVSQGKPSTASTSMKGLVGDIQREIAAMDADPSVDEMINSVSTTAEKYTNADLSLLAEIFRIMSKD
ncbi:MAG: hypothetical protein AAF404_00035 [Pseudomonadota bacterium]